MLTENLSTLKIHKLTQAQYDRELAAGRIDANALYLTPDEPIDLSNFLTEETDPTVPDWAKAPNKPSYTASDVGAAPVSHTHSANDIANAGFLATHPELETATTIPYIYNDLAFLTLKGGSVTAYTTTSTDLTAETLEQGELNVSGVNNLFNGTPSVAYLMTDGNYVAVIDIVLHKIFQWSNKFYIDFGLPGFRAKNIAVYAMNKDTETAYTLKNSITGNSGSYFFCTIEHDSKNSSGTTVRGFNRLRIVLSNFNQSGSSYGRRIAEIGLVNYSSAGVSEVFVSRGGCSGLYGSLIPQTNSNIDLGSSAKKWNNIYGTTIYQNGKQVANKDDVPTNFAVTGKVSASGDLNTVINSGMYRLEGLPANCPEGAIYGQLLVTHGSGDTISQIVFDYNNCRMWVRSGNPTDVNGSGSWHEWVQCYTTGFKPTPDDIGALSLSGGTMTGTLYGKTLYQDGKQVANKEDVSTISSLVGDTAVSTQISNAITPIDARLAALEESVVVVHSGSETPIAELGNDGDIYLVTE